MLSQTHTLVAQLPQELERRRVRVCLQQLPQPIHNCGRYSGPPYTAVPARLDVVAGVDRRLLCDPLYGALADAQPLASSFVECPAASSACTACLSSIRSILLRLRAERAGALRDDGMLGEKAPNGDRI